MTTSSALSATRTRVKGGDESISAKIKKPLAPAPAMNPTPVSQKAMLVSLNIKFWTGRKKDKIASKETQEAYRCDEAAGVSVSKKLIPDEQPEHKAFRAVEQQARITFRKFTKRWEDGVGILKASAYWDFSEAMRAHEQDFWAKYEDFERIYPTMHQEWEQGLAGLRRPGEYPRPEDLRQKFSFSIQINPLPEAGDWRVSMSDEENKRIKESIEPNLKAHVLENANENWQRLYAAVTKIATALNTPKKEGVKDLRVTSFTALDDLCRVLTHLNLSDDPEMYAAIEKVRENLTEKPADTESREVVAVRATEIKAELEEKLAELEAQAGAFSFDASMFDD